MIWNRVLSANPSEDWIQDREGRYHRAGPTPIEVRGYLIKVRLNREGYDERGRYWGIGQPLYMWEIADEQGRYIKSDHIRATDRNHAKDLIRRRLGSDYKVRFAR